MQPKAGSRCEMTIQLNDYRVKLLRKLPHSQGTVEYKGTV